MGASGKCQRMDCCGLISQVFCQLDLCYQPQLNPLVKKISKHSIHLGERVPLVGEVWVYQDELDANKKKPDLDVEAGQMQEEEGIGGDSGPEPGVGQAQEFVKELIRHIDQDHPLLAFHFLI